MILSIVCNKMNRKPIMHPLVQSYLDQVDISSITAHYTRPVNVLFPQIFSLNVEHINALLDGEMIDYTIYFANKATKADIFVHTAKEMWIWIDVSSYQELQDPVQMWYKPENILANGPKDLLFLKLCLEQNVMISVDSLGEIQKILDLSVVSTAKLLLRIRPPQHIATSRFGITKQELLANEDLIIRLHNSYTIYWLNFHIDSINLEDKQMMINHLITVRERLMNKGILIKQLGIWWWFGVQYTQTMWPAQHSREYPQPPKLYWMSVLDELLHTEVADWFDFKTYIRETMSTLHIEPWRRVLNNCWVCIHHVIDKKNDALFIDGNIYSLWAIAQDMPHDPLPYPIHKQFSETLQSYYIYGNLCLENDKIFNRPILLPENIDIWDIVMFYNTAWYFSDFSDAEPIKHNERKTIIAP